jgi:hypothetical protein
MHRFEIKLSDRPGLMIGSRVTWIDPDQQKKTIIIL